MMFRLFARRAPRLTAAEYRARVAASLVPRFPYEPVEADLPTRLHEASGMWALGQGATNEVVMIAAEMLAGGYDTPSLRILAGLSVSEGWWEARKVVIAAFDELGLVFAEQDSDEAKVLALRYLSRVYLRGELSARDLGRSAHQLAGYEGPDVAQPLVSLDDEIDLAELSGFNAGLADQSVDARVREFLASTA